MALFLHTYTLAADLMTILDNAHKKQTKKDCHCETPLIRATSMPNMTILVKLKKKKNRYNIRSLHSATEARILFFLKPNSFRKNILLDFMYGNKKSKIKYRKSKIT
jgi:hypothetical protein